MCIRDSNNTYDTGTLTTADAVLALYGYSIKVELSDKTVSYTHLDVYKRQE